jgi:hypothetical protein
MQKLIGTAAMLIIAGILFTACGTIEPTPVETTDSIVETSAPEEAVVEEATSLPYENSEYGFKLSFPETWAGYTVEESTENLEAKVLKYLSFKINFEEVFGISIYKNSDWNDVVMANEGPIGMELDSSDEFTFTWYPNQGTQDEKATGLRTTLEEVVNTFELK